MIELEPRSAIGKAARNERRKAFAATCNTVAVAFLVSALLQPLVGGELRWISFLGALIGFVVLQGLLHYILSRVED